MSELISVAILSGLALWGIGCWRAGRAFAAKIAGEEIVPRNARRRASAARFILMCLLLLLFAEAPAGFGQTATSSAFPANPTYVDAVTGVVTIPPVTGQAPVTGMIDYTIDGGPLATATVSTGSNFLNLGQLSIGSHVLTFQSHPGSPSASPIVPPPPVSIPVGDQSFGFVGVYGRFNSNYTDANLFSSAGLAIDSKDTVWIADSILSKLVSFDIFGNINNVAIASLPIPIANPAGLAFDSNDNLFISDRGNSRIIKYTPAGVETVLPTPGLGKPRQLMLDKVKNLLYIVDQDNERVVRYDLSAMTTTGYPFTGLTAIQSIALDPAGNVYVSDNVARFLKNVNGAVSALPVNAPIAEAGGIYVDRAGLLYLTDSSINGTYRIDAQGHQTQISDFDSSHGVAEDSHGRIYFGTSTNVRVFTPAGELGTPAATKSMFSNSDQNNSLVYTMPHGQTTLTQVVSPTPPFFYDVETLSCPYIEIHGTCSFQVNFAPQVPGVHTGSISTTLPGGPTIKTLLYGNAVGPAPAFSPGTQTQTASGAALGENVALDESGNYYVSDSVGNQVYETTGGVTRPVGFNGLSSPNFLAVDGSGAVYVLDRGNNRIAKLDRAGNQTYPVIAGTGNALSRLDSFAMDGGGQIYFAGPAAGGASIYLYDRTGATSLVASGPVESAGLALDPYGDIYSLQVDGSLLRIDFHGKESTLAPAGTFHSHGALAVDASETAYVAQDSVTAITLVHPDGTSESIPVAGLNHVGGIAVDGTGSILAVDSVTNQYTFVDRTHQDFNFGDVPVNTSKTFNSFLGNAGTQPFNITGLPSDSNFQQVTSADPCSTSGVHAAVAPASSCNLSYTVAPTAIGAVTAYSGVSTNVSQDSDTFTENAVRVPVAPTFLPASAGFGNVNVGSTAVQPITLKNNDSLPLALGGISITGGFTVTGASTCVQNETIAAGGSCSFAVQFAPTVAGMAPGALTVQYTGGSATANLSGTGVATASATLTPSKFDYGSVTVGAQSAGSFSVSNTGTVPILISSLSVTGGGVFKIQLGNCAEKIPASSFCELSVLFEPTAVGPAAGVLTIVTNAGTKTSALTGTGVAPTATLTPASYDFGSVTVGASSGPVKFQLTNTSSVSLTLSDVSVAGNGFHLLGKAGTLAPGASATFEVAFAPTSTGAATGTLSAVTSVGTLITTLTGTGVTPRATLTPASYDFGNVTVEASSGPVKFQLTNTSSVSLTLSGVSVAGNGFHLLGKAGTLAPGASATFEVAFAPTSTGAVTGTLSAVTSVGTLVTTLTGTGVTPTATLTPASYDFGSVTVGATSNQLLLKFTNTGTTTLHPGNATSTLRGLQFPATAATTCTGSSGSAVVTLSPGGSCILAVDFAPTTAGIQTGVVSIPSEAGNTMATIAGTGIAPSATLTPATYDFGSMTVGATSSQLVLKLTNTSSVSLHMTGPLSSSPAFVLLMTASSCTDTTVLAPGGTCNLAVDFSPTAVGIVNGTISIGGDAGAKTATLTGTGIAPTATLTPASYSFGDVLVGTTSSQVLLRFTNTSTIALHPGNATGTVRDLHFPATAATTCSGSSGSTAVTLSPGASCYLAIDFAPTMTGAQTGTVSIPSEAGTVSAAITGTGVAPVLSLTPASYNFGSVQPGNTPTTTLTLKNSGSAPAAITVSYFEKVSNDPGNPFSSFSQTSNCPPSLAVGASCGIAVTFTPVAGNQNTATISVNAPGAASVSAALTGTGAPPTLSVTPASVDFGRVTVGSSVTKSITLTNTSKVPINITKETGTGDFGRLIPGAIVPVFNSTVYDSANFACAGSQPIASGSSCTIVVTFTPPAAANYSGSFTLFDNAGSQTVTFTGNGVLPTLTVSPATLDFGAVAVGSMANSTVTLTNTSSVPINFSKEVDSGDYGSAGTGAIAATIDGNCAGQPLAPGASCTFIVSFAPQTNANYAGSLTDFDDAGSQKVTFLGRGVPANLTATPSLTVTPSHIDFGPVAVGTYVDRAVTYTNTSNVPITFSGGTMSGSFESPDSPIFTGTFYNCGQLVIAPGSSCTELIEFAPQAATNYSGGFTQFDNAGSQTVTITGAGVASSSSKSSIDFGGGFAPESVILNGPATVAGGTLQLTAGASSAASSAFFPAPASTTSFTTDFTFQLLDPTAEGFTFTIQGDGPGAVGLGGGGLGYQGLAKSIAVKFDLKDTAGEGADSTGIYVDGVAPTIPAVPLASSGIDLHSGDIFALHITYDGTTEFISLTDTVTKAVWTTQAAEDIPGIVGSKIAYFGFTAGSVTPAPASDAVGLESPGSLRPTITAGSATQQAATSTILTWTVANGVLKTAQTIIFPTLPAQTYGTAPIHLAATSSSGLPVSYTVSGPAKLSGSMLTITGAGEVSVAATQPGNASFAAAVVATRSFAVAKAPLTVTADSDSRAFGTSNPALTYKLSGLVDGDTASVVGGTAVLATTAVPTSPAGNYPITFTSEGLTAANYSFAYMAGTLTITPGALVIAPSSGNFGSIAVGKASPAISFTVTNNTVSTMGYLGYTNLGEFYLQPGTCHLVNGEPMLKPGQSCVFTAVFQPTKPGPVSGNLSIETSSGTFNVPMTGTGSTLVISPSSGNFGSIAVGRTSPVVAFTVTNDTTSTMGYLGYLNLGEFYLQPGTCHLVNGEPMLKAGQSCVFTAAFQPTKAGPVRGNLSIQTSSGTFNVPMTGTGSAK